MAIGDSYEGELTLESGSAPTNKKRKTQIQIQSVIHTSQAQIDFIADGSTPAYGTIDNILEYIRKIGAINNGNAFQNNGTTNTMLKEIGSTSLPFNNRAEDPFDPVVHTDPNQGVVSYLATYRDGSGGYITGPLPQTNVVTNLYDTGTGNLVQIPNQNRWTIRRIYFFSATQQTVMTFGQSWYTNKNNALNAIFTEDPDINPLLSTAIFITALVVKDNGDLSDITEAEFFQITGESSSSSAVNPVTDLQLAYDNSIQPQITTSQLLGALVTQCGSDFDTDSTIEVKNKAGVTTYLVTGEGELNTNRLVQGSVADTGEGIIGESLKD